MFQVYDARVAMGLRLANKISGQIPLGDVSLLLLRSVIAYCCVSCVVSHVVCAKERAENELHVCLNDN